jgi:hypothetical protein
MADPTKYYGYITKNSNGTSFKTVSTASYGAALYGEEETVSYPLSSSIAAEYFNAGFDLIEKKRVYALENSLNRNLIQSPHFAFSSSLGNKQIQDLSIVSIPSIFFGSSIKKGSVKFSFFITGTLLARLEDSKLNGELIETYGSNSGSVAGVVLYNQGFAVLTGSWNLNNTVTDGYIYNADTTVTTTNPKWKYWGAGINKIGANNKTYSSSFDLEFDGTTYIPTITMLAHVEKGDMNFSNNPTFLKFGEVANKTVSSGSTFYAEPSNIEIKNIKKYPYENFSGSLEKETYITKVGIFDENRNLIAIAKLAKPIKKTEERDFTFKIKVDI